MTFVYLFVGVVHPERACVEISSVKSFIPSPAPHNPICIEYSIFLSKLAAKVTSEVQVPIDRLKVLVQRAVSYAVNAYGFTKGYGYEVEITQVVAMSPFSHEVFGVENQVIRDLHVGDRISTHDIARLSATKYSYEVEVCLRDLREALVDQIGPSFYCYRAIESLRQFFQHELGLDDGKRKQAWDALCEATGTEPEEIELVRNAAKAFRHGDFRSSTEIDFSSVLATTWAIAERFFHYALEQESGTHGG